MEAKKFLENFDNQQLQQYKQFLDSQKLPLLEIQKNIQAKLPLSAKADEYKNAEIVKHLKEMEQVCNFYRGVRGDGNCFYRAIGYVYFETIIQDEDFINKFYEMVQEVLVSKKLNLEQMQIDSIPLQLKQYYKQNLILNSLENGLKYLYRNKDLSKEQFQGIFYEMINKDMQFDFSLIILIRSLALHEFDTNEMVEFMFENKEDLKAERTRLITYGEEAQGTNLDFTYNALKVQVTTHQIDKERYTKMTQGNEENKLILNQFFRPGHYDICYKKGQQQNQQQKQLIQNKVMNTNQGIQNNQEQQQLILQNNNNILNKQQLVQQKIAEKKQKVKQQDSQQKCINPKCSEKQVFHKGYCQLCVIQEFDNFQNLKKDQQENQDKNQVLQNKIIELQKQLIKIQNEKKEIEDRNFCLNEQLKENNDYVYILENNQEKQQQIQKEQNLKIQQKSKCKNCDNLIEKLNISYQYQDQYKYRKEQYKDYCQQLIEEKQQLEKQLEQVNRYQQQQKLNVQYNNQLAYH